MYWRRFHISSIPVSDPAKFEIWLTQRWLEKESLIEQYAQNGRFPADEGHDSEGEAAINGMTGSKVKQGAGFIETKVQLAHWYEIGSIYVVLSTCALIANIGAKMWNLAVHGNFIGRG